MKKTAIPIIGIVLAKVLVHCVVAPDYGHFRDELYYIACSDHLDWGYVDHPHLSILLLKAIRWIAGDSFLALRFLPVLAGVGGILITVLLVRRMGGGPFAQSIAALSILFPPIFLATGSFYSM